MTEAPQPIVPDDAALHMGRRAVLDVRAEHEFAAGHLPGSGNVAGADLTARRAELPPREAPVLVVAESAAAAAAGALRLVAFGFHDVRWLAAPWDAVPGVAADRAPAVPLWRPNPFLVELLPLLPAAGRAIDLACGSGRDAVFLAGRGWDVEAWDFDTLALGRAQALAKRSGVTLRTLACDLEAADSPLPDAAWDLIVCFRFLYRPLLPRLERALAPGGHLIYETYRAGQERFGKPQRRRFLLEPGELRAAFPGLEVVRYDEPSPAGGPWTSRLLARRPG